MAIRDVIHQMSECRTLNVRIPDAMAIRVAGRCAMPASTSGSVERSGLAQARFAVARAVRSYFMPQSQPSVAPISKPIVRWRVLIAPTDPHTMLVVTRAVRRGEQIRVAGQGNASR